MTTNAVALKADDAVLDFTQGIRRQMVTALMPEGKVPTDKEGAQILLGTLNDMDRQVVNLKRIKVDEKANDNTAMANAIIADVINRVGGQKIFEVEGSSRDIPVIEGSLIEDVTVVPGELADTDKDTTFDSFMESRR